MASVMSSSLKGWVYPIENERAGLLREWVMDGYGQFWSVQRVPTNFGELIDILLNIDRLTTRL
jgi:hypothetical protein